MMSCIKWHREMRGFSQHKITILCQKAKQRKSLSITDNLSELFFWDFLSSSKNQLLEQIFPEKEPKGDQVLFIKYCSK